MPYIDIIKRYNYNHDIEHIIDNIYDNEKQHLETHIGVYNYIISKILFHILKKYGLNYRNIALITGMIENVKQEFYRRIVTPYEDKKISENGDIGYEQFNL